MKGRHRRLAAAGLLLTTGCGFGEFSDGSAPLITITSPIEAEVRLLVTFSADVIDDTGVAKVQFLVDGAVLFEDTEEPYSTEWATQNVLDGVHLLQVHATDLSGNTATVGKSVVVDNTKQ